MRNRSPGPPYSVKVDLHPVIIRFAYAPDMFRPPPPTRQRLDMDLMGFAITTGYRREDFIQKLEEGAKKAAVKHPPLSSMADQKWEDVVQIPQKAVDDQLVVAREAALRQRRRARGPDLWVSKKKEEPKRGKPLKKSKRRLPGGSRNSHERHKDFVENGKN